MIGAIAGDIIGSVYEYPFLRNLWEGEKPYKNFELFQEKTHFTDDTTLSLAVADAILKGKDYGVSIYEYGHLYLDAGYGGRFKDWLKEPIDKIKPYQSFGNGSGMRVSAVAWAFDSIDKVLEEARKTALPTHDHLEGIKGAQAVALAVYLARIGASKLDIKAAIQTTFGYDLERSIAAIRPSYKFDTSCQGSIPESIICFLESKDVEDAIRLGVSLGGDTDTMASIAGAIAEAFYKEIPQAIYDGVQQKLDAHLWSVLMAFEEKFHVSYKILK